MIRARIHEGRIELEDPIPEAWEGQGVKIVPLTPEDDLPDLEARLAALHALGPIELAPEERAVVAQALRELDEAGKRQLDRLGANPPS